MNHEWWYVGSKGGNRSVMRVVQMPVFGTAPNARFSNPEQRRHSERQRLGDPMSIEEDLMGLRRVADPLNAIAWRGIGPLPPLAA